MAAVCTGRTVFSSHTNSSAVELHGGTGGANKLLRILRHAEAFLKFLHGLA